MNILLTGRQNIGICCWWVRTAEWLPEIGEHLES
jgi:hypothetical protein